MWELCSYDQQEDDTSPCEASYRSGQTCLELINRRARLFLVWQHQELEVKFGRGFQIC